MIWRRILGVIAGLLLVVVLVTAAEGIAHVMYPPPPGTNMRNMAAVKEYVATLPVTALVIVLAGWSLGTLVGTSTAARIGRSVVPAYVLGVVVLAGGINNAIQIPQPPWFTTASFVIFIGMTIFGARLGTINAGTTIPA